MAISLRSGMKRIAELDTGTGYDSPEPVVSFDAVVKHMATSKGKRQRENWSLQSFFEVYNRGRTEPFEWVEYASRRTIGCSRDATLLAEVTELLEPDRQRDKEYKDADARMRSEGVDCETRDALPAPPNFENELITRARNQLSDKFLMPYPQGSWLIVYFNLTLYQPYWDDELAFAASILQKAVASLPRSAVIEQLWLLTNDLRIATLDLGKFND